MNTNNKKIHLELLRVIAIFFVVFNHTNGFSLYAGQNLGTFQSWIYTFISVCCKVAVPLFMMISGALLLAKDASIKNIWKTKIPKIALVLLLVSLFYFILNYCKSNFDIKDFIIKIYTGKINGHLWYLYLFLGYLICVPLLSKLVKNLDSKHFVYMLIIILFFTSILPTLEYMVLDNKHTLNSNFKITWLTSGMVGYPCMGYFIEHKLDTKKTAKFLPAIWGINILCILLTCYITRRYASASSNIQAYINNFVITNAMTLYITAKVLFEKIEFNKFVNKCICSVGGCTFGIYLFHIAVKDLFFMKKLTQFMLENGWNPMISYLLFTLVVVILTYAGVWILKKIPGVKKII